MSSNSPQMASLSGLLLTTCCGFLVCRQVRYLLISQINFITSNWILFFWLFQKWIDVPSPGFQKLLNSIAWSFSHHVNWLKKNASTFVVMQLTQPRKYPFLTVKSNWWNPSQLKERQEQFYQEFARSHCLFVTATQGISRIIADVWIDGSAHTLSACQVSSKCHYMFQRIVSKYEANPLQHFFCSIFCPFYKQSKK